MPTRQQEILYYHGGYPTHGILRLAIEVRVANKKLVLEYVKQK